MGQALPQPYVPSPGDIAEGTDVDFKLVGGEDWHIYKLEDGTTFQLRTILMGVKKVEPRWNADVHLHIRYEEPCDEYPK